MSEHPKRKDYANDSDFLDAMADYHGIDRRMLRHIPIPKMTHDDDTCPHLVVLGRLESENARLKAEVERLTKAGDAMAQVITEFRCGPYGNRVKNAFVVWKAWNAAKEGKQP